jgi:hypothetical protein
MALQKLDLWPLLNNHKSSKKIKIGF